MVSLTELRLRAARARIAEVASANVVSASLGSLELRPHQRLAVARATQAIARHGGCLLADDVGRGKTFVALAIARHWEQPLAVVPASLRTTWHRAMARARVPCAIVTHEALSRGGIPPCAPGGVIVDESHRFRSPNAKRHAALASITAHVPVLLLSATPLQNDTRDLAAQLSFFLGSAAFRCSATELAPFVVRSAERDSAELPHVVPPAWLHTGHDDGAVLQGILALPPPARPFDGGDAGALRTIGLVRAWASSRATLVGALRRRLRAVTALEQCAASGLTPSRRDLRAWHGADGDVQLAFASLLVPASDGHDARALEAVGAEHAALDRLCELLRSGEDPDQARVAELRRLRAEHPEAHILAFSEFATTVRAYFALLRADAGVGMLTADDARIASGRLSRDALLDRFAPVAQGAHAPPWRERVTLLLTTDLLSEGVNLQDASIVVHLDLPWNPARLAQRLGRVRRQGGAPLVRSYLMSPPATTELLLHVDTRLRAKLAHAERAIGRTFDVMPALAGKPELLEANATGVTLHAASAELLGDIAERIARWRRTGGTRSRVDRRGQVIAAVESDESGWLAALDDGRIIARVGCSGVNAGVAVGGAVTRAGGSPTACSPLARDAALADVGAWLEREALSLDCGVHADASLLDAAIERRCARVLADAARHERPRLLHLATELRNRLGTTRSLGAERELEALLASHAGNLIGDAEWLARSIEAARCASRQRSPSARPRVVALIVLGNRSG